MEQRFELIREWAEEKGIYADGDVKTQFIKLQEETGELAKAILNKDYDEFVDAIGDCVVVLTSIAELGNKFFRTGDEYSPHGDTTISIEKSIDLAYEVIAKRSGRMINGTFVKNG